MNLDPSVARCGSGRGSGNGNTCNSSNKKKRQTLSNSHPLLRRVHDDYEILTKAVPLTDPLANIHRQRHQDGIRPPRSFQSILDNAVDVAVVKFQAPPPESFSTSTSPDGDNDEESSGLKKQSVQQEKVTTKPSSGPTPQTDFDDNNDNVVEQSLASTIANGRIRSRPSSLNDLQDDVEARALCRPNKTLKRKTI